MHVLRGPGRISCSSLLFGFLLISSLGLFSSCGGSDVSRVGLEDVSCAPYGDNRYAGNFTLKGSDLSLSVLSAAGQCCVLVGATLTYRVEELESTSMSLVDETGLRTVWTREPETESGPAIVGTWKSEDGQTLEFDRSGSFSGTDLPSCFEPPSCGSLTADSHPQRALAAIFPWLAALAWLWLIGQSRCSG